ncbi:MAG TPA: hypothetical protein VN033_01515 [Vulgatibacter sp.]|nr:hypothetical protein [Vulgatibacter sp.]
MIPHPRIPAAALVALAPLAASAQEPEPEPKEEAASREPQALPIRAEARPVTGESTYLAADLPAEGIAPESTFVLTSEHALVDLRVRLLDEGGKLVPTRDRAAVGAGTVYEIRPAAPLITGTNYRIEIDGQHARRPSDVAGTSYLPQSFEFRTLGEKPPPPPPPAKKSKRGRRR